MKFVLLFRVLYWVGSELLVNVTPIPCKLNFVSNIVHQNLKKIVRLELKYNSIKTYKKIVKLELKYNSQDSHHFKGNKRMINIRTSEDLDDHLATLPRNKSMLPRVSYIHFHHIFREHN